MRYAYRNGVVPSRDRLEHERGGPGVCTEIMMVDFIMASSLILPASAPKLKPLLAPAIYSPNLPCYSDVPAAEMAPLELAVVSTARSGNINISGLMMPKCLFPHARHDEGR